MNTFRMTRARFAAAGMVAMVGIGLFGGSAGSAAAGPAKTKDVAAVNSSTGANVSPAVKLPWRFKLPGVVTDTIRKLAGGDRPAPPPTTLNPRALHDALLQTTVAANALPNGFIASAPKPFESKWATSFGAIGTVSIAVSGPDALNSLLYYVFTNEQDAKRFFDDATTTRTEETVDFFKPSGLNQPAGCERAAATVDSQKYGITDCYVLSGNVVVKSTSWLSGALKAGKDANAIALAKSGVTHLETVRGK